jgi:subtilisin-like proprotein convertase family protein
MRQRRQTVADPERLESRLALTASVAYAIDTAAVRGAFAEADNAWFTVGFSGPQPTPVAASFLRAAALDGFTAAEIDSATEWVVRLVPGSDAATVALSAGATASRPTGILADTHIWTFPEATAGESGRRLGTAQRPRSVVAAYPLVAREQAKRLIPNDPLFANQWHLLNTGQGGGTGGEDANVTGVWEAYLGTGVLIAIVDDGLQRTHPDLAARYVAAASYDFNGNDPDPTPVGNDAHGTAAAGVAAGSGNNSLGISGAAPGASLAGLRLIATAVTDAQKASALTYALADIDIYNNSWGPSDTGQQLVGPGPLTLAALERGITQGRDGRGAIYVWSAGNGLQANDNVNYDGYANSRYTIAVTAIDNFGQQAPYAEPGAPILVAAHSDGGSRGITTTDLVGTAGYNTASSGAGGDYTNTFGGTSSSAPLVSGVVALMLEANPQLTWRDVQHVLIDSARRNDPSDADWTQNGSGRWVNHKYGYGAVDAEAAVALAETWMTVAPEVAASSGTRFVSQPIPDNNATGITSTFTMSADLTTEWVEVTFAATHPYRGDLEVVLTSPSGTQSVLAEPRGDSGADYTSWTFTSARHWGESSAGDWTLTVRDRSAADVGSWTSWSLDVYGTEPVVAEPPTLAITTDTVGPVLADGSATITFTVDQPVSGFTLDDVAVTGGTLSRFSGSGAAYTATFTPQAGFEGVATIGVPAAAFTNALDLGNESVELSLPVDAARPTVTISRTGIGALSVGQTATITFATSEVVINFGPADVSVVGGFLSGFTGTGSVYTALLTPATGFEGTATITIAAGAFTDTAGNGTPGASLAIPVDTRPPTLVITRPGSSPLAARQTATITFAVSESVTNFAAGDIGVDGGTLSGFTGAGGVYTALFTPAAGFEGTATIMVAAGAFTDAVAQPNPAAMLSIPVDTLAPVVTLAGLGGSLLIAGSTATIMITLSEPVTNLSLGSLIVSGGSLSSLTGSGTAYQAVFRPSPDFRGAATISLPALGITDPAGNGNAAAAGVTFSVDTVVPTMLRLSSPAAGVTLGIGATAMIVVEFSEPIQPIGATLVLRLNTGARLTLVVDPDGQTARGLYTVQPGEVTDALHVTAIIDDGGLRSAAGNRLSADLPPPGLGLSDGQPIVIDGAVKFIASGPFSTDPTLIRDLGALPRQVPIRFTTAVTGVTIGSFQLHLDGREVPLRAARLVGGGANYSLFVPVTRVRPAGLYALSIHPGASIRAVANGAAATATVPLHWGYRSSVGFLPDAPDVFIPTTPAPLSGRTAVPLAWGVPRGNAGGPVFGYLVAASSAPSVTITRLAASRAYEFRVAARNPAGLGSFSTPVRG